MLYESTPVGFAFCSITLTEEPSELEITATWPYGFVFVAGNTIRSPCPGFVVDVTPDGQLPELHMSMAPLTLGQIADVL